MAKAINKKLFSEAKKYLAGGVNSPVRSFKAAGGSPIFVKRAKGCKFFGEDGRQYIDYCQSYGALILGHSHPQVTRSIKEAAGRGTTFGAPTKLETELAKAITQAIPSIERIRLTNSGTEAVMGAVRLARAFTGRNKIIKFKECYHGASDSFLSCPGIPEDFKKNTLVSRYNDIKKTLGLIKRNKDIAAIIVEPIAGNMGVIIPEDDFLSGLKKICHKYNILLIFDEVITGFRFTFGGAQKLFGIIPDLTCLGKIIGGGLPVAAFGGRKEIMRLLAPEGPVYQAGTFSGNPLTVSAGLATLRILSKTNPYPELKRKTAQLCEAIKQGSREKKVKLGLNYFGPMFSIRLSNFKKFYHRLLEQGIYFAPSSLEANFISTAHSIKDLEKTLQAVLRAF